MTPEMLTIVVILIIMGVLKPMPALECRGPMTARQGHQVWSRDDYSDYYMEHYAPLARRLPDLSEGELISTVQAHSGKIIRDIEAIEKYINRRKNRFESFNTEEISNASRWNALQAFDLVLRSLRKYHATLIQQDFYKLYKRYQVIRSNIRQLVSAEQAIRAELLTPRYEKFIERFHPTKYHPMKFGANAVYPSYLYVKDHSIEEITRQIDLISQTGVDFIRISVVHDHWMDGDTGSIDKISHAVDQIRNNNKMVYIGCFGVNKWYGPFMFPAENVAKGKVDFGTWRETYFKHVRTILRLYHPDIINIGNEAPWMLQMQVDGLVPVKEWINVTLEAASIVKTLSPATFVIVNVETLSGTDLHAQRAREYFSALIDGENIDAVGIDDYDLIHLEASSNIALANWNRNKELWIGETWDGLGGPYLDNLAEKYIIASVYLAQSKKMNGYLLYECQNLHTRDFKKTPAFYTYRSIIEEVRSNAK